MPGVILTDEDVLAVQARLLELVPGAEVVRSTDPRRAVVLAGMSAARAATGTGWDAAHAARYVSVALPALVPSPLPELTRAVPFAGNILADLTAGFDHPTVFLSPAVEQGPPATKVGVLTHEFGHLVQPGKGTAKIIAWCIAYGLHPEHRVMAAEAPCYVCDLALRVWVDGADPDAAADAAANGLRAYGAGDALVRDARRLLSSHVVTLRDGLCPAVLTLVEAVRVLHARGVKGLPSLAVPPRV